jgi:hypothetical protein
MFSDLLSGGSSNARVPSSGDVSSGAAPEAMHTVEDIFECTARSAIERLKKGIAPKALEAQEREQVFMAEVATVPAGSVVVLEKIVLLVEGSAEGGAKGIQVTAGGQAAGSRVGDHKVSLFRLIALGAFLEADEDTSSVGGDAHGETIFR